MKKLNKYKYIYLFIVILSLIGLLSGYFYYNAQSTTTKEEIITQINIKEELQETTTNNILKRIKETSTYLICGLTVIPEPINIFHLYYEPFTIGFIFNTLKTYNLKFSLLYTTIYHLIPTLFKLILIRITMTLSYTISKYLFKKQNKDLKRSKILIKKYLLISCTLYIYEFILFIFNTNIHRYLMTFLHI